MPLVVMTREMGSLGKDVADALAQRVGKKVVYHEIIDNLANKMRLRKSHVIRFLDGKAGILERLGTDQTSLSIYTADETFSLAESNEVALIRGWGATHLLRGVPHVIRVRVCAPFEIRVQRMMDRLSTDDRDFVVKEMRLAEESQGAIVRRHFDVDWQDAEHYDLVLNTERLGVQECVDEIMLLHSAPAFAETAESRRILSDLALAAHVRAALRQDTRTNTLKIRIVASEGVVTLGGVSETVSELKQAAVVAAQVPGVSKVVNELRWGARRE